ncbi:MAG: HPr family phosphocarrier protein [Gammaproteobacteria bacterium]|nr:HPr family phosphocarrier protein [Gammaproteobacteria bacterium]NNM01185.1 HPr family phosphocarrier protein [Gammaproteobacteria bacterium]
MPEQTITIINKLGLHARAAAKLVQLAAGYDADISVTKDGKTVNGKSIMGVMMLAAAQGSELSIATEGPDADEAMAGLTELINDRFGEGQ